jgi:CBS domain-containing protein
MTFGAHVLFFGTGFAGGLWLAFIGWFLHGAAAQSYRRLAIDDALAGHTVEEIMRRGVTAVSPALPLSSLVHDHFVRSDERALPVVDEGELLGLVSIVDLRRVPSPDWPATPVASVMHPRTSLAVTAPDAPLGEAFAKLAQDDIEQLPVLEGGRLVGMLQRRDIARWLKLAWGPIDPQRSRSLPDYESRTPPRDVPSAPHGNEPHPRST